MKKKLLIALSSSILLSLGLTESASATLMPKPLHFVNVAKLPQKIELEVGEMLCLTRGREVTPYVGVSLNPAFDGALRWVALDERSGPEATVACFDAVSEGESSISILASTPGNELLDVTVRVIVE